MLNLQTVSLDIQHWIENFLEVPNPALNNWSPCPYARAARQHNHYQVRLGQHVYWDLAQLSTQGLDAWQVLVYVYDAATQPPAQFAQAVDLVNRHYLVPHQLIALLDHPELPESVNGVSMNHGQLALALVQSLPDLNQKSHALAQKGFYHNWPRSYLDELFRHRQDPTL